MNKKPSVVTDVYLSDPYLVNPSDYHVQFTIRNPYDTTMLVELKTNFDVHDFTMYHTTKTYIRLFRKDRVLKITVPPKGERMITGHIPYSKDLVDENNSMFDINYRVLNTDILETLEIRSKAKTPRLLPRGQQSELIEKHQDQLYRLFWIFHTVGEQIKNGKLPVTVKMKNDTPSPILLLPTPIYLWGDQYMVTYLPKGSSVWSGFERTKTPTVCLFKNGQEIRNIDLHSKKKSGLLTDFIDNLSRDYPDLFRGTGFAQILTKHMLMENEDNPQITQAIVEEICRIFNNDNIRMK